MCGIKIINNYITAKKTDTKSTSSQSSRISATAMQNILGRLKVNHNRKNTNENYFKIWRRFNSFVIRLDTKPPSWEDKVSLFIAHLIETCKLQSSTVKSYVSAIKCVLKDDGYEWNDNKILLNALTRACRLKNDRLRTQLPIQCSLLEMLLFEIVRKYANQPYLQILFKAVFILSFYGLFRVGEVTTGDHPIKAKDIHIAANKEKILVVLYTSKTHGVGNVPQKVKIVANNGQKKGNYRKRNFCPFKVMREYMIIRGSYKKDDEPLFIFADRTPIEPSHLRSVLKETLKAVGLNQANYGTRSFRAGRSVDLVRFGYSIDEVKRAGRWKSGAIYRYLKSNV